MKIALCFVYLEDREKRKHLKNLQKLIWFCWILKKNSAWQTQSKRKILPCIIKYNFEKKPWSDIVNSTK